jgi:acid phosphatase
MENDEYGSIIGNACCPYIASLVSKGALFTNSVAVTHPSLPNYLAMTSGGTDGRTGTDDVTAGEINVENVFHQLSVAGFSWGAYQETMPSACYKGAFAGSSPGTYALKHDPAMAYQNIATTSLCNQVVPYSSIPSSLPNFSFITPNQCNDMHSCSTVTGDRWLLANVPSILAGLGSNGRLIITFDEGTTGTGGGGHIATIELGPGVPIGQIGAALNHYGLLAAIEDAFGLARLQNARSAAPFPLFNP